MKLFLSLLGLLAGTVTPCPGHYPAERRVETHNVAVESGNRAILNARAVSPKLLASTTVKSTVLVIARNDDEAQSVTSGLNGYGIPFQVLIAPKEGATLPALTTSSGGNFGSIVTLAGLSYEYEAGAYRSAISETQWSQLYDYQTTYGVRMVQLDVYPQAAFGTNVIRPCCDDGVEQLISFSNTSSFAQAGLRTGAGAGMSTFGLYHYITEITDPSTTWEIAQFAPNSQVSRTSTAAVINNFSGREQMAFFITWATSFSTTSNYLQHAYITWMTRGLYAGFRRVGINAQIDDMMLGTPIYKDPAAAEYRLVPDDMTTIKNWIPTVNKKMKSLNPGSTFTPEIGYNGNGNFIKADQQSNVDECKPHPIYTDFRPTADLEFQKPLGTGYTLWPATPLNYTYSLACTKKDPLSVWFQTTSNRDAFYHISHTFTHEHLNNVTYDDVYKEIQFNQKWLAQTGLDSAAVFSSKGMIPPAITGMHNGDALRAFYDLGLRNCVGDNARPRLRNTQNTMWPIISNMAEYGFEGFNIIPRWPSRIYYNCDTPRCTLQEWTETGNGNGDFVNLMNEERKDVMRYFFGLYREGYMFHQINLRNQGMTNINTADGTQVRSLYQAWVEYMVQEFSRLANWPMVTLKQDDLAQVFFDRMTRDKCGYTLSWKVASGKITGVTVGANGNTCAAPIPVTIPGGVTNAGSYRTEQIGSDPFTIWVKLGGSAVTLTLKTPITM